ncbi:MAG: hypothetical protein GX329_00235 [Tissierellia bacterium]|nr:hypothetical protein [Tissierellia bacterium]
MKHEWRRHEKDLYVPKQKAELVTVLGQKFLMIDGKGDPNSEDFSERVQVLYSLAYAIRMMPRQGYTPEGYFEYTVYPLEGLWNLTEKGRKLDALDKDELLYTIMIRQPDFVTKEVLDRAFENVRKKKPHPLLDKVKFDTIKDGLSVQILHIGSYDNEAESFQIMKDFITDNNLEIATLKHREIYLSDPRRVAAEKLKTVLRYRVKQKT